MPDLYQKRRTLMPSTRTSRREPEAVGREERGGGVK
jgi:hypothetical protein